MTQPNVNWPKKGDRAFPECDGGRRVGLHEVFVMPSEEAYLIGFKLAGDIVVRAGLRNRPAPDYLFFPVAHLYRHHLELMLKELVRLGVRSGSLKGCKKILVEHNLHKLWNKSKQLILEVWPDSSKEEDIRAAEHLVLEFHKIDRHGQTFRYACDTEGKEHLKDGPKIVDLRNLKKVVDAVSRFLDASYAGIEACDPGLL